MMMKAVKLRSLFIPLVNLFVGLIILMVYWYGGLEAIRGRLTIDQLFVFSTYAMMMLRPFLMLGMIWTGYQRMAAAGERVFEIIEAIPDVKDKPNSITLPPIKGHVVFENVSFGYDKNRLILKNINLEAKPGEVVALLGPTGSGKSTIIRLIPRFYDVTSGRILIDGYDIRDVTLASLRSQIAIVLQEPFLFNTTVKENIRYGNPNATDEDIIRVAKELKIHDLIMRLPQGYDTQVGEGGKLLSTGERQLISFARALLADPRILILDEATASVDSYTEQLIQEGIKKLMEGRTAIIIAHRLSTIRNVDKIVLMHKGEIVDVGTHEEMLSRNNLYRQLYQMQFLISQK